MEVVLERNVLLSLALLAALSCSDDEPSAVGDTEHITDLSTGALCPDDGALTYDSFGKGFMGMYCTRCHTSKTTGEDRLAPPNANFDDLVSIRMLARQIDKLAAAGPQGNHVGMPPSEPYPAMEQREKLGLWLACGAPGIVEASGTTNMLQLEAAGSAASP